MKDYTKIKEYLKSGFFKGVGLGAGFLTTGLFAAAAAMNVFSPGQVISSSELNQNFSMAAPEGFIGAFYLSSCPDGWAIADGTNGTPDLRGRFIRGMDDAGSGAANVDPDTATRTLGSEQLDAFQGHWHRVENTNGGAGWADGGTGYTVVGNATYNTNRIREAVNDGTNGNPRTTSETRPRNIALIYCMRQN